MYPGPLVRTYSSYSQYELDKANMAQFGFYPTSVQKDRVTDGCLLTVLLIIGLLLTPVCIGLVILLFIPTAFSTRVTAYYSQPIRPPAYPSYQGLPPHSPGYPAPVTIPLAQANMYAPAYSSPHPGAQPPKQPDLLQRLTAQFMVEWRELMAEFRALPALQQVAWVVGILALVSAVFIVSLLVGQTLFH